MLIQLNKIGYKQNKSVYICVSRNRAFFWTREFLSFFFPVCQLGFFAAFYTKFNFGATLCALNVSISPSKKLESSDLGVKWRDNRLITGIWLVGRVYYWYMMKRTNFQCVNMAISPCCSHLINYRNCHSLRNWCVDGKNRNTENSDRQISQNNNKREKGFKKVIKWILNQVIDDVVNKDHYRIIHLVSAHYPSSITLSRRERVDLWRFWNEEIMTEVFFDLWNYCAMKLSIITSLYIAFQPLFLFLASDSVHSWIHSSLSHYS